jgi:hypothetical protein
MKTPPIEAIVAGTKGFTHALLAPIAERVGGRPRVASDTAHALVHCSPGGIVVVEFLGEDSLSAIQDLVLEGGGLRIVAAVPPAHAAAEGPLRALGVDAVRWDGTPDGILGAVERQLAAAAAPARAGARAAPPAAAPAPAHTPVKPIAAVAPARAVAPPPWGPSTASADAPWPTAVPGPVEAADAFGRALLGHVPAPGAPLAVVADVVAGLSPLERAVFSGQPQPFDTEPVRRAAVVRVRVAAALATAPGPGGAVDAGAVSAFLADIDALLSDVNALAAEAPAAVHASLEAMRNVLVREAIDFSEAVQRAGTAETSVAPAAQPAARARAPQPRVLSITASAGAEPPTGRRRGLAVALALAVLAAGGFHGYRYVSARSRIRQAPTLSGLTGAIAPASTGSDPNAARAIATVTGAPFDPQELEAFKAEEAKKGNVVKQISPGAILVVPAEPGASSQRGVP